MATTARGHIEQLPSGSFRVHVYAGTDPVTGKPRRQLVQSGRWDDMCDRQPFARPGRPFGVPRAVPFPARYDNIVSAQPAEREDPLDPQRILDQYLAHPCRPCRAGASPT